MAQEWYYDGNGQKHGPISGGELIQMARSGKLKPTDKVKKDGMADWLPASQVKGLFPDLHDKIQAKASTVTKTATTVSKVAQAAGKVSDAVTEVAQAGEKVQKAVTTVASIAAGGSTLAGSIGDFLRPLGPINFIVFAAALLSGGVFLLLSRRKAKVRVQVRLKLGALASLAMALIFGIWTGLGAVAGKDDKGFLATNIKPVEQLQASIVPAREQQQKPAKIEQPPLTGEEGWVSLFNGKDLAGWKTNERANWRVRDGVIVGSGPGSAYLFTEQGDYADFHLRAEFRINEGGNSGIMFRCSFPNALLGYEGQISSYSGENKKLASHAGAVFKDAKLVSPVRTSLIRPDEWATIEVFAEGRKIRVSVNGGKVSADYTDNDNAHTRGFIALQQHDPDTVVYFRKIEVKRLSASPQAVTPPPSQQPAPTEALPKGWGALSDTKEQVQKHWRQGDTRGSFFYDAPSRTIKIKSVFHLGTFTYDGPWLEFHVEVEPTLLLDKNKERFNLQINRTTLELGPAVAGAKGPVSVTVRYDPNEHAITGLVDGKVVDQATVTGRDWNKRLECEVHTGGGLLGDKAIVSLRNARVLTADSGIK